jgi:hypothetical protein
MHVEEGLHHPFELVLSFLRIVVIGEPFFFDFEVRYDTGDVVVDMAKVLNLLLDGVEDVLRR